MPKTGSSTPVSVAVRALTRHGWQHKRTTGSHAVYAKPGFRPISVRINHQMGVDDDTVRVVERAIGKRLYESKGHIRISGGMSPLSVVYDGQVFAYVDNHGTSTLAQDLETGAKVSLPTAACEFYYEEDIPREEQMIDIKQVSEEEAERELTVEQEERVTPPPTPLTNQSDLAALIRLTQRRVEALNVEYEQARNRMESVQTNRDATIAFLRSLGVEVSGEERPVEPKRTILPPTTGNKAVRGSVSQSQIDRIRILTADGKMSAPQIAEAVGVSSGTVYNYQKKFREERT